MTIAIAVAIPGLLLQASERIADGAWITRAESEQRVRGAPARQQRRSDAAADLRSGLYGWEPTIGRTRTVVVQS